MVQVSIGLETSSRGRGKLDAEKGTTPAEATWVHVRTVSISDLVGPEANHRLLTMGTDYDDEAGGTVVGKGDVQGHATC